MSYYRFMGDSALVTDVSGVKRLEKKREQYAQVVEELCIQQQSEQQTHYPDFVSATATKLQISEAVVTEILWHQIHKGLVHLDSSFNLSFKSQNKLVVPNLRLVELHISVEFEPLLPVPCIAWAWPA